MRLLTFFAGKRNRSIYLLIAILISFTASASADRQETGKTFNASGATIYYEVIGKGPGTPLILANGGPGFDHMYFHVTDAWDVLGKDRQIVFYDQRGNGRAGALKEGQTCTLA